MPENLIEQVRTRVEEVRNRVKERIESLRGSGIGVQRIMGGGTPRTPRTNTRSGLTPKEIVAARPAIINAEHEKPALY